MLEDGQLPSREIEQRPGDLGSQGPQVCTQSRAQPRAWCTIAQVGGSDEECGHDRRVLAAGRRVVHEDFALPLELGLVDLLGRDSSAGPNQHHDGAQSAP